MNSHKAIPALFEKVIQVNRIIELPIVILEPDMLDILSRYNYKPNYLQ